LPAVEEGGEAGLDGRAPTPLEARVIAIWTQVLGHDRIGLEDNFFDAGGSSLLLFRLQAGLQADFDRPVELMELFRRTTVPAMAQWLGGVEPEPAPVVSRQSIEAISRRLARQRQRVRGGAREESPA